MKNVQDMQGYLPEGYYRGTIHIQLSSKHLIAWNLPTGRILQLKPKPNFPTTLAWNFLELKRDFAMVGLKI